MQGIIFGGCSYTFGEGLELYTKTDRWIEQRNHVTHDKELYHDGVVDNEGTNFRLENNFGGLVGKYYNIKPIIHHKNGGCFASALRFIDSIDSILNHKEPDKMKSWFSKGLRYDSNDWLDDNTYEFLLSKPNIKAIIIQFSCFDRDPIHFNYKCKCDTCYSTTWKPMSMVLHHLRYINEPADDDTIKLFKIFAKKVIPSFDYEKFKKLDSHNYYNEATKLIDLLEKEIPKMVREGLELIIDKIKQIEKDIAPIYFIDSWDEQSSKYLFENDYYFQKLIPLKGDDGKYYKKWTSWEKTLKSSKINDDFPKTQNFHPSLHAHKKISESITKFIDKNTLF